MSSGFSWEVRGVAIVEFAAGRKDEGCGGGVKSRRGASIPVSVDGERWRDADCATSLKGAEVSYTLLSSSISPDGISSEITETGFDSGEEEALFADKFWGSEWNACEGLGEGSGTGIFGLSPWMALYRWISSLSDGDWNQRPRRIHCSAPPWWLLPHASQGG